jgi:hypothetical protein
MADLNQIVENSITYNGPSSQYTQTAQLMRAQGTSKLQEVIRVGVGHHIGGWGITLVGASHWWVRVGVADEEVLRFIERSEAANTVGKTRSNLNTW